MKHRFNIQPRTGPESGSSSSHTKRVKKVKEAEPPAAPEPSTAPAAVTMAAPAVPVATSTPAQRSTARPRASATPTRRGSTPASTPEQSPSTTEQSPSTAAQSPNIKPKESIITGSEQGQGGSGAQGDARKTLKNSIKHCVIDPTNQERQTGAEPQDILEQKIEMKRAMIEHNRFIAESKIKLEMMKRLKTEAEMRNTTQELNQSMVHSLQLGLDILADEYDEKAAIIRSVQEAREKKIELIQLDDSAQDFEDAFEGFDNEASVTDDSEDIVIEDDEISGPQEDMD